MGTRGAWGFIVDGVEKLTYNHCDSYPDGLGADVLRFLRNAQDTLDQVRKMASDLRVVDPTSTPTAEDIERLKGNANINIGTRRLDDWYVLLRETQGDPLATLAAGVIEDGHEFPLDSLFCEFAYVIDLDAERFDAYVGFRHAPPTEGRWVGKVGTSGNPGYHPCQRVGSWPLAELPTDDALLAAFGEGDE